MVVGFGTSAMPNGPNKEIVAAMITGAFVEVRAGTRAMKKLVLLGNAIWRVEFYAWYMEKRTRTVRKVRPSTMEEWENLEINRLRLIFTAGCKSAAWLKSDHCRNLMEQADLKVDRLRDMGAALKVVVRSEAEEPVKIGA